MKSFKGITQGIQGDVAITRIKSLPKNSQQENSENGFLIVAHSETGHNHAIAERQAKLYGDPNDPLVGYLVVAGDTKADLEHHRSFDTHETVQLDKGVYRIDRQREYTPKGLRRVAD